MKGTRAAQKIPARICGCKIPALLNGPETAPQASGARSGGALFLHPQFCENSVHDSSSLPYGEFLACARVEGAGLHLPTRRLPSDG